MTVQEKVTQAIKDLPADATLEWEFDGETFTDPLTISFDEYGAYQLRLNVRESGTTDLIRSEFYNVMVVPDVPATLLRLH